MRVVEPLVPDVLLISSSNLNNTVESRLSRVFSGAFLPPLSVFSGTYAHMLGKHLGKIGKILVSHGGCHLGYGHGGGVKEAQGLLNAGLVDEIGQGLTGFMAEGVG